ncbi:Mrp/NBP35 family ATP-binding protein [bacterium]|nr:Mrp/NBP35 family ATP-binding protein [bacterium]
MTAEQHDAGATQPKAGSKSLAVLAVLRDVKLGDGDIVGQDCVRDLSIAGGVIKFTLALPPALLGEAERLSQQAAAVLRALDWTEAVEITPAEATAAPAPPPPPPAAQPAPAPKKEQTLPNVRHVIAVGSGKGGVGKSTVSVNLALALVAAGHKVGLLDADVYGPSIPLMLGVTGQPMITKEERIIPLEKHGLKLMSMGFLLAPDQAVVWRGPMVHGVIRQFIADVDWGELDFLIVDLPPGTGDAPLSMSQELPLSAAIVVTTPQEVAAAVAQKAMSMFDRLDIRILGIIENMSYFVCPHCHEATEIFDRGGGKVLAANAQLPLLGEIPIDVRMRKGSDIGAPVVVEFPDSDLAQVFKEVAARAAKQMEAAG